MIFYARPPTSRTALPSSPVEQKPLLFLWKVWQIGGQTKEKTMIYVTDAEFQKNFGRYRDAAHAQPVRVLASDRSGVVLITADRYEKLVAAGVHLNPFRRA